MRNKDNPKYILAMIWKVLLLIVGFWGLLDGAGITKGQYTPNFPHMFTNVSNLFGWGYFALALIFMIRHRHEEEWQIFAPTAKYTATISLLVTMIIGHVMLFGALVQDGPGIVGVGGVVRFCGAMLVLFIILGYVLYGIDHLLGKHRQKSGTAAP